MDDGSETGKVLKTDVQLKLVYPIIIPHLHECVSPTGANEGGQCVPEVHLQPLECLQEVSVFHGNTWNARGHWANPWKNSWSISWARLLGLIFAAHNPCSAGKECTLLQVELRPCWEARGKKSRFGCGRDDGDPEGSVLYITSVVSHESRWKCSSNLLRSSPVLYHFHVHLVHKHWHL